jgi:hypothetical protein
MYSIDRVNAQWIARALIAEIASGWSDTPIAHCIQKDEYHVFEFVIEPPRYSRLVRDPDVTEPRTSADSVVIFNPFPEATEIVREALEKLRVLHAMGVIDDAEFDYVARRDAKAEIRQMINVAPDLFKDSIWQARLIGGTVRGVKQVEYFGRIDLARGMVDSVFEAIQARIKKRMPEVSKTKKNPKINRATIGKALEKFFPRFKESKELPSQRQFAIAVGVTPKAWRAFLATHYLDSHEVTMKQWYEVMLREEVNPRKEEDFPFSI